MCSWAFFFIIFIPFAHVLCYNIKFTDYAILVNMGDDDEPGIS